MRIEPKTKLVLTAGLVILFCILPFMIEWYYPSILKWRMRAEAEYLHKAIRQHGYCSGPEDQIWLSPRNGRWRAFMGPQPTGEWWVFCTQPHIDIVFNYDTCVMDVDVYRSEPISFWLPDCRMPESRTIPIPTLSGGYPAPGPTRTPRPGYP